MRLAAGLRLDPLWEHTALPQTPSWIKGDGRGRDEGERGGKRRAKREEGGERREKGREREGECPPARTCGPLWPQLWHPGAAIAASPPLYDSPQPYWQI